MTAVDARALTEAVRRRQAAGVAPTIGAVFEHVLAAAKAGASTARFEVPHFTHDRVIEALVKELQDNGFTVGVEASAAHPWGLITITW
ncbi:unnamed protein product [Gemmataceae bacterium]|nr:unnamed protein product [Gemmataceae bacterium]VTU02754.1 unnamed protein product [Gemmataceae bacterium]